MLIETEIHRTAAARAENISFVLFVLSGIAGVVIMATSVLPFGRGYEMVALAENLARHGTYANPFQVLDTGPTAVNPPLYPLLLSVLFRVFGNYSAFVVLAATVANIVVNALIAAWLPRVSWLFYREIRPGAIAGVLWVFVAQLIPSWDASYTMATLLLFCIISAGQPGGEMRLRHSVIAGLLAAASFLFSPTSVLVFLPWTLWLVFFRRTSSRQAAYLSLSLAIAASIAFMWALRNDRELGHFVVRTGFGTTLYASNNDCARPSILEDEGNNCFQAHHPNMSLSDARILRQVGEVEFEHMRVQDAKAWIGSHPRQFFRLTVARIRDFWFPPLEYRPASAIATWIATVLSVPGLLLLVHRRQSIAIFAGTALLVYPILYYVVISDPRYRYPVLWLTLLLAGYFVHWLIDRLPVKNRIRFF
jgi:hypothetical protein